MVRLSVASVVVLAACAADPEPSLKPVGLKALETVETLAPTDHTIASRNDEPEVCALADQLPPEDLCSLICDPDALYDALIDAGVEPGRCYLLLCELPEDTVARVGICLY